MSWMAQPQTSGEILDTSKLSKARKKFLQQDRCLHGWTIS